MFENVFAVNPVILYNMKYSLHEKFAVFSFGHFAGTEYSLFTMVYTCINGVFVIRVHQIFAN